MCIGSYVVTYGHDHTGTTSWDATPHFVGCVGRSHFALHSYAFMEYIEMIFRCCYEVLSYGYVLKLEANKFTLILYLVYSISGTLC